MFQTTNQISSLKIFRIKKHVPTSFFATPEAHIGEVPRSRLVAGVPGPSESGEAPGTPNEATWPPGKGSHSWDFIVI